MTDVFDKIIAGEIPSYKVYEDEDVLAFLDLAQSTPGHTLAVPKKHIGNIFDYDDATAEKVLSKLPMIARAIKAANPKIIGMNILSNNGSIAGQSVPHSHWHLIPRFDGDGLNSPKEVDNSDQYDPTKYEAIADAIRKQFK